MKGKSQPPMVDGVCYIANCINSRAVSNIAFMFSKWVTFHLKVYFPRWQRKIKFLRKCCACRHTQAYSTLCHDSPMNRGVIHCHYIVLYYVALNTNTNDTDC